MAEYRWGMTEQSLAGAVSHVVAAAVGAVRRRRRAGRRRRRDNHRRRPIELNALYVGTPPWDIGRPQSAFLELAEAGLLQGRVLDVGCGTGEHALLAAGRGLPATGIDAAAAAIAIAEGKARDRDLPARFLVWDALELAALGEQFDTVLDCGLFHVFDDDSRSRYIDSLKAVIPTGGRYFMLCFRGAGEAGGRAP